MTIGDFIVTQGKDVDPIVNEIALIKQLIMERTHPLELLRELISNAGAQEVGARTISITYYVHPVYGHAFQVTDDGCGMNFTGDVRFPGRLDRFLGLGLSAISGLDADEFAWKGLGSKLAYQSRRVEIETYNGKEKWSVVVNEPWQTIEGNKKPRPQLSQLAPAQGERTGTAVRVFGHPPHRREEPFKFEEIRDYLAHRTFVGYTRDRPNPPRIELNVQSRSEELTLGFPELRGLPKDAPEGTVIIDPPVTVRGGLSGKDRHLTVTLKGFYTWDDAQYGLADVRLNTGLVLAVKGIPYFTLDMRKLASGQLAVANPGPSKCCLVVECDSIQTEMNISRGGLVDSESTNLFHSLVQQAIKNVEEAQAHLAFRQVPKRRKERAGASQLLNRKAALEDPDQAWVYWQPSDNAEPLRLFRVPENETDTLAVLWKLEALRGLPFKTFETLAYSGTGADLVVHFQEDESGNPERYATMEVEYRFFNFKAHGHLIPQLPKVICWELNPKPKLSVKRTAKLYKYVVQLPETNLWIYTLKDMPGVSVATLEDIRRRQASNEWKANL